MNRYIDAHIHLDLYEERVLSEMLGELPECGVEKMIAVSRHQASCERNLELAKQFPGLVRPAFGFHPEQPLPPEAEMERLLEWIRRHAEDMAAIGEVGLPYYSRTEAQAKGHTFHLEPYITLLESFVKLAGELRKPIVLHAVYEDADIACDLLEKHNIKKAHFHWFKGSDKTVRRMIDNGYSVSFTPDIVYEPEIQQLAAVYPLGRVMAETDGPWPFEGPFQGSMTHPRMLAAVVDKLASIRGISPGEAADIVRDHTVDFYNLT